MLASSDHSLGSQSEFNSGFMGGDYNFHTLSPEVFEKLAITVLSEVHKIPYKSFGPSRDGGWDAVARRINLDLGGGNVVSDKDVVVQVKHTAERSAKLDDCRREKVFRKEKGKVEKFVRDKKLDLYVVITNYGLPAGQEEKLVDMFKGAGAWEVIVIGKETLSQLIDERPKLKRVVLQLYGVYCRDPAQLWNIRNAKQCEQQLKYHESRNYIKTKALDNAGDVLRKMGFVFVVGETGSGKTAILNQLALSLKNEYEPQIITSATAFEDLWNANRKMFIIDDIFGKTNVEDLQMWLKLEDQVSTAKNNGAMFVVSSRLQLFEEANSRNAEEAFMKRLKECCVDLNEKDHQISRNEKIAILKQHIAKGDNFDSTKEILLKDYMLSHAAEISCTCFPHAASLLGSADHITKLSRYGVPLSSYDTKFLDDFFFTVQANCEQWKRKPEGEPLQASSLIMQQTNIYNIHIGEGAHSYSVGDSCVSTEDLPVLSRTELQAKAGSPSEEELIQLAEKIAPSWRKLGRALGLEEHKLHAIDADYKSVYEKSCQMLLVWKKMNGSQASYSWLVQALQFIGSHILAEEYCADKVKDLPVLNRTELQAKVGSPSEMELVQLAEKIAPSWRKLGRALGLEEHKLSSIDADYKHVYEKSCQMLLVWKKMNGSQATYNWLVHALQSIGSRILAEEYCADKVEGLEQSPEKATRLRVLAQVIESQSSQPMKVVQTFMQTGGERENDTAQQGASHHADLVVGVAVQQQSESGAGREDQEPLEPTARLTAQQVVEHTYRIQKRHQQTIRSNQREQEKILRNPGLAFGDNSGTIDKHWALLKPRTVFASSQPAFQSNQVEREIETGFQNGDETRIQRAGIFDLTFCDYEKATERYSTKLGSGGEGDIYHGKWKGLELAVKKVGNLKSFEREKQMKDLRHPFILPVWDVVKSKRKDQPHLIVYPYMANGNLFDAIVNDKKKIPYSRRIVIALNLVLGLKHLHSKGFVYRDFKSANVLLDENLNPRLGDYGLAKQIFPSDPMASTSGGRTTSELLSVRKGTEGYVCPVYMATKRSRPENDLFGLGVVMLELLTGCHGSDRGGTALPVRMGLFDYYKKPVEACHIIKTSKKYMDAIREAGWPDPELNPVIFKFAKLAIMCLPFELKKRISLKKLGKWLKKLAYEESRGQLQLYCDVTSLESAKCVYCLRQNRCQVLGCGHLTSCINCLKLCKGALCCPHCCDESFSLIGNPQSIALCIGGPEQLLEERILGGASPIQPVMRCDAESFSNILKDDKLLNLKVKQVHLLTTSTNTKSNLKNTMSKVDEIKKKFDNIRKEAEKNSEDPILNLLVFLSGHFDKRGNMALTGGEMLSGQDFLRKLQMVKADNILMFVDGRNAKSFFYEFDSFEEAVEALSIDGGSSGEPQPSSLINRARVNLSYFLFGSLEPTGSEEPYALASGNSMIFFRNNLVAYCSSSAEGTSTFRPPLLGGQVEIHNSAFTKFLLNGIGAARKCYDPTKGEVASTSCDICVSFREKLRKILCIELEELMSYVTAHMKLYYETPDLPKKMYVGDGSKIILAFHEEDEM